MRELNSCEINEISGAKEQSAWYNIGHAVGEAYNAAVAATTDLFCWIDEKLS